MKTNILQKNLALLAVAGLTLLAVDAGAQSVTPLPYNATQIAQLAQAKVSDDTILAYIRNSNDSYNLDASQIIYLKQQGVSEAVISTMLNQPRPAVAANTAPATAAATATPVPTAASTSTATVAPTVTYVQTVPTTTYYYNASPSYYYPYPYYGWGYSPVISVGFGGGWRGGGWHGGYGGGWHGGGGWHR